MVLSPSARWKQHVGAVVAATLIANWTQGKEATINWQQQQHKQAMQRQQQQWWH